MVKTKSPSKRDVFKVGFDRGRMKNGGITETKVFKLLPSGREKKLRPNQSSNQRRKNQGRDVYFLLPGRYRVETLIGKKGRTLFGSAVYVLERDGRIRTEKWEGKFIPNFFLQ